MNDEVLEVDDLTLVKPDEWAELEPQATPLNKRDELQRQVDEFLAQGGKVQECAPGATAVPDNLYLWSFPAGNAATPDPAKRVQAAQRRENAKAPAPCREITAKSLTKRDDTEIVPTIDRLLSVVVNQKELMAETGCSYELLQRLLYTYFKDDVRAAPLMAMSRIEREARRVETIRALLKEGHTGLHHIAQRSGIALHIVAGLNRRHGLNIPEKQKGVKGTLACKNSLCRASITVKAHYCPQCGTITDLGIAEAAK